MISTAFQKDDIIVAQLHEFSQLIGQPLVVPALTQNCQQSRALAVGERREAVHAMEVKVSRLRLVTRANIYTYAPQGTHLYIVDCEIPYGT